MIHQCDVVVTFGIEVPHLRENLIACACEYRNLVCLTELFVQALEPGFRTASCKQMACREQKSSIDGTFAFHFSLDRIKPI